DCSNITSITVDSENSVYTSEEGVLFNKSKTILIRYPERKIGDYTTPTSVTSIENYAFAYCSSLTSVIISSPVNRIGSWAFQGCNSLTSVMISNSVTSIEGSVFFDCNSLATVEVGWNIPLNISNSVFASLSIINCKLIVPAGTKQLYEHAGVWQAFGIIEEKGASSSALSVSPSTFAVASGGGSSTVTVSSNTSWTVSASDGWLAINASTGNGNGSFTVTTAPNTSIARMATITVSDGTSNETVSVSQSASNVSEILPTSITLNQTTLTLSSGSSAQLTAAVLPENATNKNVNWVSTNPAVAQVSNIGLVTGLTEGITLVGAISETGAVSSGWCTVNVTSPVDIIPIDVNGITISIQDGKLYVHSPVSETVYIYSFTGNLLYNGKKEIGEATFNLYYLPKGVFIVRGSSGWVKKIVI
ncbi:MAG: leucine-rich repeat protein, partial [Tannerella sp.]|nr:leucine-rich repeat protein [Tannerella sp.]